METQKFGKIGFVAVLVLGLVGTAFTQGKKDAKTYHSATKEVSGEVTGITKDTISVMYYYDNAENKEYEILLPIAKDVKLGHVKSLSELLVGDIVNVQYEEITEEDNVGKRTNRFAKVISFSRRPQKKPESSALDSENPAETEVVPEIEETGE